MCVPLFAVTRIAVDQIYFQSLSRNARKMFKYKLLYQNLIILIILEEKLL